MNDTGDTGDTGAPMSKHDREELIRITKARAKVAAARVGVREAELLADSEEQLARLYRVDDGAWAEVTASAERAVAEADALVAARCEELGIRPEFRPSLDVRWYGRGENAAKERRGELRKVAQTRIAALGRRAKTEIEAASLGVQEQLIMGGLESGEARAFIESMPTVEELMPAIDVKELER